MNTGDTTLKTLAMALKFREMRQELIASNIANQDTPEYKTKRLDFEKALARAIDVDGNMGMNVSEGEHFDVGSGGFANLEPDIYQDPNGIINPDGNTVDPAEESTRMTENRIMYNAVVDLMNKKLGLMKYILNSER